MAIEWVGRRFGEGGDGNVTSAIMHGSHTHSFMWTISLKAGHWDRQSGQDHAAVYSCPHCCRREDLPGDPTAQGSARITGAGGAWAADGFTTAPGTTYSGGGGGGHVSDRSSLFGPKALPILGCFGVGGWERWGEGGVDSGW